MPTTAELIAALTAAQTKYGVQELTVGPPPSALRAPRVASLGLFPGGLSLNLALIPPLPSETDRRFAAIHAEAAEKCAAVLPPTFRAFALTPEGRVVSTGAAPRFSVTAYAAAASAPEENGAEGRRLQGSVPLPRGAVLLSAKSADAFVVDPDTSRPPAGAGSLLYRTHPPVVADADAGAGTLFAHTMEVVGPLPEAARGCRLTPRLTDSPVVMTYEVWPEHEVARFLATPIYARAWMKVRDGSRRAPLSRDRYIKFANWGEYLHRDPATIEAMMDRSLSWYTRAGSCSVNPTGTPDRRRALTYPGGGPAGEESEAAPEGGGAAPEGDEAAPEGGEAAPEGGEAAPEGGGAAPEGGEAAPEGGGAAPGGEDSGAEAEEAGAAPEEVEAAPHEAGSALRYVEFPGEMLIASATLDIGGTVVGGYFTCPHCGQKVPVPEYGPVREWVPADCMYCRGL